MIERKNLCLVSDDDENIQYRNPHGSKVKSTPAMSMPTPARNARKSLRFLSRR